MERETLLELQDKLLDTLDEYASDFVNDNTLEQLGNNYVSDSFNEFADNNTNIYYYDQREYYYNHTFECEQAFINLGYDATEELRNGATLEDLICKAGMCGQYEDILNTLWWNNEDIYKLLLIDYVLRNNMEDKLQEETLNEIGRNIERFCELLDLLDFEQD